jgi:hypothetical protein
MKHLLFALLFLSGLVGAEPSTSKDALPVKGKFYYTLDDEARIFVNGTETLHLTRGAGQSKDISLKAGDRVTMQLKNVGGEKFLRLLFVAEDRSVMLPIIRNSFKCLPDPEAKDFTEADWQRYPKFAKEISDKKTETFPFKSRADYLWGDADVCAIGSILKREMFIPLPRR